MKVIQSAYADCNDDDGNFFVELVADGTSPNDIYFDLSSGEVSQRPVLFVDDVLHTCAGDEGTIYIAVPPNSVAYMDGEAYEVGEDTQLALSFEHAGEYSVYLDCWPCRPANFKVIVS